MPIDLNSKCRTCLSASNTYHQLYDYVEENYKIVEMLDGVVPQIDIKTSQTQFSTLMCSSCVDSLLTGYKFQQLCIETNNRLHDLLGIALLDTEKLPDPLTAEQNTKMKQEIEENASFECDKLNRGMSWDNEWDLAVGGGSDTDSSFAIIYHLRRHMRTHTGEKPYKCKYCERAYAESGDLTKHLRTHVGENTYMCEQCPMAFKYQAELRQHQSQHYKMAQKILQQAQKMSEEAQHEIAKQTQQEQQQHLCNQQKLTTQEQQDHNQQLMKPDQIQLLRTDIPDYQQTRLIDHSQQLAPLVEKTQHDTADIALLQQQEN